MSATETGRAPSDKAVLVRLTEREHQTLRQVAASQRRSMADQIRFWIDEALNDEETPAALSRPGV